MKTFESSKFNNYDNNTDQESALLPPCKLVQPLANLLARAWILYYQPNLIAWVKSYQNRFFEITCVCFLLPAVLIGQPTKPSPSRLTTSPLPTFKTWHRSKLQKILYSISKIIWKCFEISALSTSDHFFHLSFFLMWHLKYFLAFFTLKVSKIKITFPKRRWTW